MQYLSQGLAEKPIPRRERDEGGAAPPSSPQRERILDAVELLVAENGVAGASIEAIVKAAGVSSVTFYDFFERKEECFLAACERAVEEGEAELARAAEGDPAAGGFSWSEEVATGLRTLTRLIAAHPERARLVLVEAQTGGPQLSRRFEAVLDRVAAKLREGRALPTAPNAATISRRTFYEHFAGKQDCFLAAALRPEPPPSQLNMEVRDQALIGGIATLVVRRLDAGGAARLPELLPDLTELALAPFMPRREAKRLAV